MSRALLAHNGQFCDYTTHSTLNKLQCAWIHHYRSVALNRLLFCIPEFLGNYFSQFSKVDACTIMHDATGQSRCLAFLTFEDLANANAAMVREHSFNGKIACSSLCLQHGMSALMVVRCLFIIDRLIQNEQYCARNTNVLLNYSLVVLTWQCHV